jgi:mannose-6-phosphate isomerase
VSGAEDLPAALRAPLLFQPVYKTLVWGGQRIAGLRAGVPAGPIGESWDLADHAEGMSLVSQGPLAGRTLAALVGAAPEELVGRGFGGGTFPLMVKLIDAAQVLSVQVHPDDRLARELGVGDNGKTECWRVLAGGGVIYQGTQPGVDRAAFEQALAAGTLESTLNRYDAEAGDFFFLDARTVHALGQGCLIYEIQQTSNVTFRVYDWGRVGLDGKPRPLHVDQSLATIDFSRDAFGPRRPTFVAHPRGGEWRVLADCAYFRLEERRGVGIAEPATDRCTVVITLEGAGTLASAGGQVTMAPMQTALVPAAAGAWTLTAQDPARPLLALVVEPRY